MQQVHVAVGVIFNNNQSAVLISKRGTHQHLAGYWEFPGGKIHAGETIEAALIRELHEELGITVEESSPLLQVEHTYADKKVLLDIYSVTRFRGEPEGREQQEIQWASISDLKQIQFPEANQRIVTRLLLSDYCIISKPKTIDLELVKQLVDASNSPVMLQLRFDDMKIDQLDKIAQQIQSLNTDKHIQLVLNGHAADIHRLPVDGLHLKASRLFDYSERPISKEYILGASCHNDDELLQAKRLEVDYVFLSPVQATTTHPDVLPIGWQAFHQLINSTPLPVYALGGIKVSDLDTARSYGAHGVAMITGFWDAENPVSQLYS